MLGQDGVDPGRGGAAEGQFLDDPREQAEAAFETAEAARLQDAQNAGFVVLGDRLRRELPRRRGGRRAFGEARNQRPGALQQRALVLRQRAVVTREGTSPAIRLLEH